MLPVERVPSLPAEVPVGMSDQVGKIIELDAVGRQFEPYDTAGCVCTATTAGGALVVWGTRDPP